MTLLRHMLHILSTILGFVHRRAVRLARELCASATATAAATTAASEPLTPQRGDGDDESGALDSSKAQADYGGASDAETTPTDKSTATWSEGEGKDGELDRDGVGEVWEKEREGDAETAAAMGEDGAEVRQELEQLNQHMSEIERARMTVNLLRTLVQAELGMWEGGFLCYASDTKTSSEDHGSGSADDKTPEKRRRFSRATSLSVSALLNQALGCLVFINCKSGLDRTGLQMGIQASQSALWALYPQQRWALHLAAINWHLLQYRHSGGDEHFCQPSTAESFATEQDRLNWFRSLLRERSLIRAHRLHDALASAGAASGDATMYSDDALVFEDNLRMLRALYPLSCLTRNFLLAYLIEANALVTFASTGVRGMKYDGHPLIGALIPRDVRVSPVVRSGGSPGAVELEVRTCALYSKQYMGLKSLAGGKLAQVSCKTRACVWLWCDVHRCTGYAAGRHCADASACRARLTPLCLSAVYACRSPLTHSFPYPRSRPATLFPLGRIP